MARANAAEIELFCSGFKRLFQYMDLMSHYSYQPYGSMTDCDIQDSTTTIKLATELWLKLMPTIPMKVHAWQHLADDLKQYKGMKSHNEQAIERAHQDGKKHDRRLKCFRDFEKKTHNILRKTATADLAEVQAKLKDTEDKKISRKRKKSLCDQQEADEERQAYLKSILKLPPIVNDFPRLLELLKACRRNQASAADEVDDEGDDEIDEEEEP